MFLKVVPDVGKRLLELRHTAIPDGALIIGRRQSRAAAWVVRRELRHDSTSSQQRLLAVQAARGFDVGLHVGDRNA